MFLGTCFNFKGELSSNSGSVVSGAGSLDPVLCHKINACGFQESVTSSGIQRHIAEFGFVNQPTSPLLQGRDPPVELVGYPLRTDLCCPAGASCHSLLKSVLGHGSQGKSTAAGAHVLPNAGFALSHGPDRVEQTVWRSTPGQEGRWGFHHPGCWLRTSCLQHTEKGPGRAILTGKPWRCMS